MAQARVNGVTLEYELSGPEDGQPLLLIHGVGAQLVRWSPVLCERLHSAGFRLLRFDSRDIGLSTHLIDAPVPDLAEVIAARQAGLEPDLPYGLAELAADAVGLIAAVGWSAAHVAGVSLGGMIAQHMAIAHPRRVLSLASIMSQTGNPDLPGSQPAALAALAAVAPDPASDREGYLRHQVALNRALGSPAYPADEAELRRMAALAADRAYYPAGAARQLAAGRGAPDRRAALGALSVPALVIHGADDPLIPVEAGEDTASAIPGAWFLRIHGMGHDLPDPLAGLFATAIAENAARARAAA